MTTISIWLDSQPDDPTDYETEGRPLKRPCLGETPVNMAEPRRSRRRSPRKHNAPTTPPPSSSGQESYSRQPDDGETPRAAPSMTSFPVLQPYSSHIGAVGPATATAARSASPSRSSTTSWASGTSNRRLRSPVRRLGDLQLSDVRVHAVTLEKPGQAPEDVRELCRDIRRVWSGHRLIPSVVQSHAAALLDDGLLLDFYFGEEHDDDDQRVEHESFWIAANELMHAANECEEEDLSEGDWNNEVHSRALRLALHRHRSETAVWYRNITTAKIKDESLLPSIAAGLATQSKMVDFAMVLDTRSDEALGEFIRTKLRYEELPTINHTPAEHVRFSPIAVSIETKRAAIEEDAANVQLAVWVSAHFRWLQQMRHEDAAVPTLPLVIVQGHEWRLMFAELGRDGKITIYRYLNLGTTKSVIGVYQVTASLRRLAEWVKEIYRPWFEKEVLYIP